MYFTVSNNIPIMEIREVCSALSDETRLRLVEVVRDEGPLTSKKAHEVFTDRFTERRRESIYKAMEALVDAELLEKYYDRDGEGLVYQLAHEQLLINLDEMAISEP